jgi:hypothetical protein
VTLGYTRDVTPLRIGVKYCGGCNPGYDRGLPASKIQNQLSKKVLMVSPEEEADVIIAVQGCPTACADLSPFEESNILHITDTGDLQPVIERLNREILSRERAC